MLFGTTPKDIAIERMMTGVPNFPPRGHGIYVFNKFKYTAKDCDCRLCPYYSKKKGCLLPECECIEERIEARAVGHAEFMRHVFGSIESSAFQKRLNIFMKESEEHSMLYRGYAHKDMFEKALESCLLTNNTLLSALYLLTADKYLWSKVRHAVGNKDIHFSAVHLGNISTDAYTLFMTARDLYEGTKHIAISDIADKDLISRKMFGIICNAMAIRRYGMDAIYILEKDGDER